MAKHSISIRTLLAVTALLWAELTGPAHALFGDNTYEGTCTEEEIDFLEEAMALGRIVASSDAFEECIWDGLENYRPCTDEAPVVQQAARVARVRPARFR
jgi:hypothetical protein